MCVYDVGQGDQTIILISLALRAQLIQCGQRQGQMGVDQLLSARDLRQIQGGLSYGIQASDVFTITAGLMRPSAVSFRDSIMSSVLPPVVPITWVEL